MTRPPHILPKIYPALGLLQNPWAKVPDPAQEFMDRGHRYRRRWIMRAMPPSLTGRRLLASLGEAIFWGMAWDNGDPTVSGRPDYKAKPDREHVYNLLHYYQPQVVVCYGRVAQDSMDGQDFSGEVIHACHPAYRGAGTTRSLRDAADLLKVWLDVYGGGGRPDQPPALKETE